MGMSSCLRTCLLCCLLAWGCGGKAPAPVSPGPGSSVAIQPISFEGLSPVCRRMMVCCQELAAERSYPTQGMRCPELADGIRDATAQLDEEKVTAVCRTLTSVLLRKVERVPQSCLPVATTGGKPKAKTFTPRAPKPKKPRVVQRPAVEDTSGAPVSSDVAVERPVDAVTSPPMDGHSLDAGPRAAPSDVTPPRSPETPDGVTRNEDGAPSRSSDAAGSALPRSE